MRKFRLVVPVPCFDNEPAVPPETPPETPPAGEVKFTKEQQDKLNTLLANERKKAVAELEGLKKTVGLSEKAKKDLETQIDTLKSTYQTKAEKDQETFERTLNTYKGDLETTKKAAESWQSRFTETVIDRDLLSAASSSDAFNSELIVNILKPVTKLVETVDADGKPTGKYEPQVRMTKIKDGKPVEVSLSPTDAVKLMKETPAKYGSLFKSGQKPGLGTDNTGNSNGGVDLNELARTNPEAYREAYRKSRFPERK